jgi:hypothetical protein
MVFIGYLLNETDRAYLFQDHFWEGNSGDWFPKSQADIIRSPDTIEVKILASAWICQKKNIDEFKYRSAEEIEKARKK